MGKFALVTAFFTCLVFTVLSQETPLKRIGCHHKHHLHFKPKNLSSGDRVLLNESIARSDTFDILGYIIHIDVTNYAGAYIKASTELSVQPKMENQEFIRLDLMDLQVDSVTNNAEHLNYQYDGNILKVDFSSIPALDDTVHFTVHYQGNPHRDPEWGGFYFESNYIYNLGIGISSIPPNFGKVWYPCFDSFVERATYEYHVKSAGTYRAHCQGDFLGEIQLGGDTVIRSFAMTLPIPTHLSAIAVANYQNIEYIHSGNFSEIPVRLSAKPAQLNSMNNVLQNLGSAIDACEHWYGPYAWGRVGYVLTTDGALEIPTNIAYPDYMVSQSVGLNNGLLSHELGHHWWGDVVTPYNHNDMWLKEGPAEYSSHLMEEWMYGTTAFRNMVKTNHLDVLRNAHIDDDGFQPMSPMPDEHIYGTHTYYKGASVMHNLRGYMGDELFRLGMTTVQEERYFQTVTPEEFRDELESATGVNLHSFFNDQIFKPGFSVFVTDSFTVAPDMVAGYNTTIHLQQKLRACPEFYTNVPLDITLVGVNNERVNHTITVSNQFSEISVHSDFVPKMVILNGDNRLNQARMDRELKVFNGVSVTGPMPFVDMDFYTFNTVDSSVVRLEHIWAAPDDAPLGLGIFEISDVHYWIVDGLWNESDHFRAIFPYNGMNNTKLDFDLYNGNEQNAVLVYRASSSEPWRIYEDFQLSQGGLTDGTGTIVVPYLRKGQYAFANGDASVFVINQPNLDAELLVYPVPTTDQLNIRGHYNGKEDALFTIVSSDGKLISRSSGVVENVFNKTIETSLLSRGSYVLHIATEKGDLLGVKQFSVTE